MMLELLADPNVWIAFATLTVMEIVLGIDNIVFISVLVSRLPREQAEFARKLGIGLALVFRIILRAVAGSGVRGLRTRLLLERPYPDRWWRVPDLQGDP